MFDEIERPTAEYRLSQVLTEHIGDGCRLSTLGGVIATAADRLPSYDRARYAHKHQVGRMIRSMRAGDDDHALERQHGLNIATVIDELWQASDLIRRRIEHDGTRW